REWHAGEIAVRVSLEGLPFHEGQIVPQHVRVPLSFAEQLPAAFLEHEIGERLPRWRRTGERRDAIGGAPPVDRVESLLSADRLGVDELRLVPRRDRNGRAPGGELLLPEQRRDTVVGEFFRV